MELLPVPVADADAYMALGARGVVWAALEEPTREIQLQEAYRWLSTLHLNTEAVCTRPLEECWVAANAEVALALYQNPNAVMPAKPQGGPVVKSQALGDLSQSFFSQQEWATKFNYRDHPLLRAFPWIDAILGCWLPSRTRIVNRVRS